MGMALATIGALAALLATPFAAAQAVDPARAQSIAGARNLLRELVEIDTTPARGCTSAAEAMARRLRTEGFSGDELLLLGGAPERQNLVARLRGRGAGKPILFIAHLDVVDAPREGWSEGLDPFRLTERNGFLYGRGVLDVKHAVAGLVANLIRLVARITCRRATYSSRSPPTRRQVPPTASGGCSVSART